MIKLAICIGYVTFVAVATVARPAFLANNGFIDSISSYELLSVLGVILTITLASIVNVHFEITKIVARIYSNDLERGQLRAAEVRRELNSSAWYLVGSFLAAILILVVKSEMQADVYWKSGLNGAAIGTLLLMTMVMYDIHRSIFALASSNVSAMSNNQSPPPSRRPNRGRRGEN